MSEGKQYIEVTDEMREAVKRVHELQATVAFSERDFNHITQEIRKSHAEVASIVIAAIEEGEKEGEGT